MLPHNSRPNDIVEVIDNGAIGKLVKKENDMAIVKIDGICKKYPVSRLRMKARVGTKTHRIISETMVQHMTAEDYDELINMAIDNKDWKWAKELIEKKKYL